MRVSLCNGRTNSGERGGVGGGAPADPRRALAALLLLSQPSNSPLEDVLSGGAARVFDTSLLLRGGGQRPIRIALAGSDGGAILVITAS